MNSTFNIEIKTYEPANHYQQLKALIASEGAEWADYLNDSYKAALATSVTYVAIADGILCGYSRSIKDHQLYLWVIDLLVHKDYRGHHLGSGLLEVLLQAYPDYEVYVMSDADGYYDKLGYKQEGSIYRVG